MSDQPIPPQTRAKGEPTSPLELSAPDWKESLRRAAKEFKADRGALTAAGMAFYWFLAVFPALLAFIGFVGLIGVGDEFAEKLNDAIGSFLPGDAAEVLTPSLEDGGKASGSGFAAIFGTAVALFSASAGMVALQGGLNVVYDVPEDRKYLKARLYAVLLLVVTAVLGGVATAAIVFGAPIGEQLAENLGAAGTGFVVLWTVGRWVVGILALSLLFASYYYLGPNRESPRWTWISPGGVLATLIWLAASLGFSIYVGSFGSYAETYGSLAGVVVLLLWLFLSGLAIVLGGELNAELERQAEHRRRERGGAGIAEPTVQVAAASRASPPAPDRIPTPQPQERSTYEDAWAERMRQLRE
ncbi:MAG: YihY/virulence factor BrkB family protein, partial [Actinomycetota bacterium]|nr:YihY/virulence factor BrkB family protein [Actinomycetota bacterium]